MAYYHNSSLPSVTSFRANSLFDPEYAVGGGQPRGFDQLVSLGYQLFYTRKCKCTVEFFNYNSAITLTAAFYGMLVAQTSSDFSDHPPTNTFADTLMPGSRYKLIQNLAQMGPKQSVKLSKTVYTKSYLEKRNRVYGRSLFNDYFHDDTQNPTREVLIHYIDVPLATGTMDYRSIVTLTYYGIASNLYVAPDA